LYFIPLYYIAEYLKAYQKNCLGHLKQIDTIPIPKVSLQYQLKGRRDKGQPRRRWKVQEHLEVLWNRLEDLNCRKVQSDSDRDDDDDDILFYVKITLHFTPTS